MIQLNPHFGSKLLHTLDVQVCQQCTVRGFCIASCGSLLIHGSLGIKLYILHGGGKEHGLSTHTQKPGNKTVLLIVTVLQLYSFNYTIQFEHMTDEHIKKKQQ